MGTIIENIVPIIVSTLSMSIPLMLAAIGGTFSVRSGIMALGLESMMMVGAYCGVLGSYYSESVFIGFLTGILGGMAMGLFHGILSVKYKVNQVISGIGLNLLALSATTLLMQIIWGNKGSSPQVASIEGKIFGSLADIPVIGEILFSQSITFYLTIVIAIISWMIIFKTRFGLRMRMVGENPKAASTVGLKVHKIKYIGVIICGGLAGMAGAYLSLDHLNMFVRDMTAGRGYIALVIAILSRYNPLGVMVCALVFGFAEAIQIYLQGDGVSSQLIQMLPYLVTLLVLTFGVKHIKAPAGVGEHDD